MIVHNLTQGSKEWLEYRATMFNASDAPAMMGVSLYMTRQELMKQICFGAQEIGKIQQAIFDKGHQYEAAARAIGEAIIGEDLSPVVASSSEHPKLSASFDGINFDESIIWEHKTLNDELRKCTKAEDLHESYKVQMEQQLLVSGASKCLFSATVWDNDGLIDELHLWYESDATRRQNIIRGWQDFEKDLEHFKANYKPEVAIIANKMDSLPMLNVEVKGEVLASNIDDFRSHAFSVLESINTSLVNDQDFVDAAEVVKWCLDAEKRLESAKAGIINQTASIADVLSTIDAIIKRTSEKRLLLNKLVTSEKEARKIELINEYREKITDASEAFMLETGFYAPVVNDNFANAIKGKRTLDSMRDALHARTIEILAVLDAEKINILANNEYMKTLDQSLLKLVNIGMIIRKSPDDFKLLVDAGLNKIVAELEVKAKAIEKQRLDAIEKERVEPAKVEVDAEAYRKELIARKVDEVKVAVEKQSTRFEPAINASDADKIHRFMLAKYMDKPADYQMKIVALLRDFVSFE